MQATPEQTGQIRTIGTVPAHFRPAYDLLIRPRAARSKLEAATGTVQPDFLSGIYGGITMARNPGPAGQPAPGEPDDGHHRHP